LSNAYRKKQSLSPAAVLFSPDPGRKQPMIDRLFRDHPASVNETYLQHMSMASSFGWAMLKASGACFVHAVIPGLCERTGSRIITQLHGRMVTNRVTTPTAPSDDALLWIAANI
jgi:hypothetical protein